VSDAAGNDLDREALDVADSFLPNSAVSHHARKLDHFRDPAAIVLSVQLNRRLHVITPLDLSAG
jgi:hypothetical protein